VVLMTLFLEFPLFDGFPFVIVLDDVPDWSGQESRRVSCKSFLMNVGQAAKVEPSI
jgi:hypothetical protein